MEQWVIGLILLISMLGLLLTGLPISFSLMGLSALFLLIFIGPSAMLLIVASSFKQIGTEVFIAIPLFVLMAAVLQFSGLAASLYNAMHMIMGPLRGGLAMGTVIICSIIDALSGIGATATTTMGLIALPEMLKRGYNKKMVMGAIAAGGALGPLIPPSVLMIIVGGYAQLSVGKLFLGGIIPGVFITIGYVLYIGVRCAIRPEDGPSLPQEQRKSFWEKVKYLRYVIIPIALILIIMAGIYLGAFTPTEAAGFGALASIIIAIIYRKFSIASMGEALQTTIKISSMIMWLVMGGGCFSALVNITGTSSLVLSVLQSMPFGEMGIISIMLIIPLILGMFIDPIAISMICIPIFEPVCKSLGIDLLWFMLLFIIAVVAGYITPPFGVNIFYMKGVAPDDTNIMEIYEGVMPYTGVMIIGLIFSILFPQVVTWLPNLID